MTIDLKLMNRYWMESSVMEIDGKPTIPPDWDCCEDLMLIRQTMVDVVKGSEPLFRKPSRIRPGRRGVVATKLGRSVELCLSADVSQICKSFPQHRFNPYFNLFAEVYRASPMWSHEFLRRDVDQLNDLVAQLRTVAKRTGFKQNVANHERGTIKNGKTVTAYINAMYADYPKILHVRIDLYYELGWLRPGISSVSAEQMKAHLAKFMRYVRTKFGIRAIGHIWTVECGEMKGPHYHVFLHLDGQKVRQGITIAQQLGEHWRHVITNGRGRYWNVNKDEDLLEAQGRRGIGLISHADEKRRRNLLKSALYLVKTDLFVRSVMPGFGKTFGHGRFRPRKKSKAGRKRKGFRLQAAISAISARRGQMTRGPVGVSHSDAFLVGGLASPVSSGKGGNRPLFPSEGDQRRPLDSC